jgi:hypothetical protein
VPFSGSKIPYIEALYAHLSTVLAYPKFDQSIAGLNSISTEQRMALTDFKSVPAPSKKKRGARKKAAVTEQKLEPTLWAAADKLRGNMDGAASIPQAPDATTKFTSGDR